MRMLLRPSYGSLVLLVMVLSGCSAFQRVTIFDSDPGGVQDDKSKPSITFPSGPPPVDIPHANVPSRAEEEPLKPDLAERSTPEHLPPMKRPGIAPSTEMSHLSSTLEDVFFDYDQYTIREEAISSLEQNASVLLTHYPNQTVLIEGHCDERGTEEYNLVLGNRRARVVKDFLVDLGVPASHLQVLSLGKSEPFCLQATHQCFQENRRAHFVLQENHH